MPLPLPVEIVSQILGYLPQQTHLTLAATNKYLRTLALPYVYDTIHLSAPDARLDEFEIQRQHFRRLNQLLRSLVNNRVLAGYIRRIELVRWNVDALWAGIRVGSGGGRIFTQAEMQQLKLVLESMGRSVGYPVDCNQERAVGVTSTCDALPALVPLDALQAEKAARWWMKQLKRGSLDASFAVLLFLVNKEQASRPDGAGRALRELRLKLDHTSHRQQPECLWWLLWQLLGNVHSSQHRQWIPNDHGIDVIPNREHGYDHSVGTNALPCLQKVEITATRWSDIPLGDYDCNLSKMAVPFLFHRSLSELRLTLLDKSPFTWEAASTPPHLFSVPTTQLRYLYLKVAHVESLHSILSCTPKLSTLSFTQLQNFEIRRHRWVDISILASALALVKESLTTLTLRIFVFGALDVSEMTLGRLCGPKGNTRELKLWEFLELRNLTIGLTLLLGVRGSSGMTLAEALPEGLEALGLVFDVKALANGSYWEHDELGTIVSSYMKTRGKGVGGQLQKLVFVYEMDNDFYDEWKEPPEWRDWPPKKLIPQLEMVAGEAGVLIDYAGSQEHMRWHHDSKVATQFKGGIIKELPCHSKDMTPVTEAIDGVTASVVPVWGDFRQDVHVLNRKQY